MGHFKCSLLDAAYPGTNGRFVCGRNASDKKRLSTALLSLFAQASSVLYPNRQTGVRLSILSRMRIGLLITALKGTADVSATASVLKPAHMLTRMLNEPNWRIIHDRKDSSILPECALTVDRARRSGKLHWSSLLERTRTSQRPSALRTMVLLLPSARRTGSPGCCAASINERLRRRCTWT